MPDNGDISLVQRVPGIVEVQGLRWPYHVREADIPALAGTLLAWMEADTRQRAITAKHLRLTLVPSIPPYGNTGVIGGTSGEQKPAIGDDDLASM